MSRPQYGEFWRNERGFTLPEVMITIILMGIVFAIASASWLGLVESRRVDSATNQLASDLRLAHTKSTNQLTEYHVAYVPNGTVANCSNADYCLVKKAASNTYEKTPRHLPEGAEISGTTLQTIDTTLATLLGLGTDTRTIKFSANGAAQSAGGLLAGETNLRITVSSDDGNPSHVTDINSATSRVQIDP